MKKYFVCLVFMCAVLLPYTKIWAQQACCSITNAHTAFAMHSNDAAFNSNHELPLPYQYQGIGKAVTFKGMDGKMARGFELRSETRSDKWLLVFHEFWGLNDYVKKESERLHKELGNVNVLAIDLYDGKVGSTREEAKTLMQAVDSKRAVAIVEGAIRYTGDNTKIATIGWCFGGTWSLQAALHADKKAVGCVMYYGQPETDIERLSDLDCSVLAIFASQDKWLTPAVAEQFKQNMKKAGKQLTVEMFDADHAFANPSSERYKEKAAQQANAIALKYLQNAFSGK